jgi:hypothetical protein
VSSLLVHLLTSGFPLDTTTLCLITRVTSMLDLRIMCTCNLDRRLLYFLLKRKSALDAWPIWVHSKLLLVVLRSWSIFLPVGHVSCLHPANLHLLFRQVPQGLSAYASTVWHSKTHCLPTRARIVTSKPANKLNAFMNAYACWGSLRTHYCDQRNESVTKLQKDSLI